MPQTTATIETLNPQEEKLEALKSLFPEAFREGKLDTSLLSATLGDGASDEREAYGMSWAGKSNARKQILTPTTQTLTGDEKASMNWDTTDNILIEWNNLEVLKLLQKGYTKQVKMIYIDPPYNTGKDFVYHDNFHTDKTEYEEASGQRNEEGKLVQNTETNGRYHSDWLSMMYPRLHLARNLLRDDGIIFVSIDDHEVHNLRKIMDEVFGEENFIGSVIRKSKIWWGSDSKFFVKEHEYILIYSRSKSLLPEMFTEHNPDYLKRYKEEDENGKFFWDTFARPGLKNPINYDIALPDGSTINWDWIRSYDRFIDDLEEWIMQFIQKPDKNWSVQFKQYLNEDGKKPRSLSSDLGSTIDWKNDIRTLFDSAKIFSYPKPIKLVKFLAKIIVNWDDTILDFFAGSGTTGHAVMSLNAEEKAEAVKNGTNPDEVGNRKYICVQLDEATDEKSEAHKAGYKVISEITAERLRRAGKKIAEENPNISLDVGFRFYRLSPSCYQVANVEHNSENPQTTLESLEKAIASGLSPLREWVTEADVLTENLLKEGFPLNARLSNVTIGTNNFIHTEREGKRLYVTFEKDIPMETIQALGKDYSEAIFVVYDTALDDSRKVMLSARVKLRTI